MASGREVMREAPQRAKGQPHHRTDIELPHRAPDGSPTEPEKKSLFQFLAEQRAVPVAHDQSQGLRRPVGPRRDGSVPRECCCRYDRHQKLLTPQMLSVKHTPITSRLAISLSAKREQTETDGGTADFTDWGDSERKKREDETNGGARNRRPLQTSPLVRWTGRFSDPVPGSLCVAVPRLARLERSKNWIAEATSPTDSPFAVNAVVRAGCARNQASPRRSFRAR